MLSVKQESAAVALQYLIVSDGSSFDHGIYNSWWSHNAISCSRLVA